MVSGLAFQRVLDVVRQWWLSGLKINGRYALTDDCARRDMLRYYSVYASKLERQERGAAHLHVMIWRAPASVRYVELPRVTSIADPGRAAMASEALALEARRV